MVGILDDAKSKPSDAVRGVVDDVKGGVRGAVKAPLEKIASAFGVGGNPFIANQVRKLTEKITNLILAVTTLEGFMESSTTLVGVVDKIEEELVKHAGKAEEIKKEIASGSHQLWHEGITKVAMTLYVKIFTLQGDINSVLSGQPADAVAALTNLLSKIFEVQLRAFNGIRIAFIQNLNKTVHECKDGDAVRVAVRAAFKEAVIPVLNLLAYFHWVNAYTTFEQAAEIIVLNAFNTDVWPHVVKGLEAIQSCIPQQLQDMGLQLPPLAQKLANMLITKGVAWVFKKVMLRFEEGIFAQAE